MTPLLRLDDVPDGGALVVAAVGGSFIVTRRGRRASVFRNRCPHAGYPLQRADGSILVQEQRFLVCAAHGASFDIETGACVGGPCNGAPLERVAAKVVGTEIFGSP